MKKAVMLKKLKLTDESLTRIREAVMKAESRTTGEIALAVTAESAAYSFRELLAALTAGVFIFALLLPFAHVIAELFENMMWHMPLWYLPAFYGITCFGLVALLFRIANVPAVDRLIVPRAVRSRAVYNRAVRYFAESGVYATKDHSGILIFVSYMEREVRIIADTGITAKISPGLWNLIAADLAEGLGTADAAGTFIRAVERCGELLEEYFPAVAGSGAEPNGTAENPDELANGLVVLEEEDAY
ncbi:TPM domain-containing protein [Treponema brennaborense]|uniref:TPM domain-containing protein n=1 Tax=Treponema brennaborense (strain DSM 12168 / CIP 105900 / DD5/3) TaxID=906968 RepID=F4LMF7_TREBD|nr:TPM domain-containing protein [Treponema brennaborense]AEE15719.1 protein of unknown function DUF477 [Treponema brennaborense DSM 12168]